MVFLILSMLFAIIIALFAIQNAYTVAVGFLWLKMEIPLVLVIFGSAFAGALIVFLIALWREFNLKRRGKAERKVAKQGAPAGAAHRIPAEQKNRAAKEN